MLKYALGRISVEVPKNAKILDVGCGTGMSSLPLVKRFPEADVTGVDFSESMIKEYISNFPNAKAVIGDFNDDKTLRLYPLGESIAFPDSYFDIVISSGALSEYGNLKKAMPFIYSKIKKSGVLINVGINDGSLNKITGFFWKYSATGKKKLFEACKGQGFGDIEYFKIPLRFFPNNYRYYIIKATK